MNALKRARTFLGYTQKEMADAIGVSARTYQRREALAEEYVPKLEALATRQVVEEKVAKVVEEVMK